MLCFIAETGIRVIRCSLEMCRKYILHILYRNFSLWHAAPWDVIAKRCIVRILSIPFRRTRIEIPFHKPRSRRVINMIRIIMRAESKTRIETTIEIQVQMVLLDEFPKICRTHMVFLLTERIFQIKIIDAKLIRHHDILVIRNALRHPMMSADALKPPDLIAVLKGDTIHLVGAILLE